MSKPREKYNIDELFATILWYYHDWEKDLSENGWNQDSALAAAHYYGMLCGVARMMSDVFGNDDYADRIQELVINVAKDIPTDGNIMELSFKDWLEEWKEVGIYE